MESFRRRCDRALCATRRRGGSGDRSDGEKSACPAEVTVVTNDRGLAGLVRAAGGQVRSATQFASTLARPSRPSSSPDEPAHAPHDPAFADIYAGFVATEKDASRFGADIDLDVSTWIERLYGNDPADAARAAHWLGRFGGPAGLAPLLDALTHRQGQIRSAALLALAELEIDGRFRRSPNDSQATTPPWCARRPRKRWDAWAGPTP